MTPEYIEELADIADSDSLWKLPLMQQLDLPEHQRRQLDAGIALRRHAAQVRRLGELLREGRSLLITPLSPNGAAVKSVKTPPDHARLREARQSIAGVQADEQVKDCHTCAHNDKAGNQHPCKSCLVCFDAEHGGHTVNWEPRIAGVQPCAVDQFSSRMCARGTKGCTVAHGVPQRVAGAEQQSNEGGGDAQA